MVRRESRRLAERLRSVTLVIDAAPLVALADEREPLRAEIHQLLAGEPRDAFVPAPVACA